MNPIVPLIATALPVKMAVNKKSRFFTFFVSTPIDFAASSPNVNTSISLEYIITPTTPTIKNGSPAFKYDHPFIENEPICHIVILSILSVNNAVIVVRIALKNNENTRPANIIVLLERLLSTFEANFNINITVNKLHINPISGNVKFPSNGIETPVTITIPTPSEAPDDIPNVYGDANGFFNTD